MLFVKTQVFHSTGSGRTGRELGSHFRTGQNRGDFFQDRAEPGATKVDSRVVIDSVISGSGRTGRPFSGSGRIFAFSDASARIGQNRAEPGEPSLFL